jgi:hypothetical protein
MKVGHALGPDPMIADLDGLHGSLALLIDPPLLMFFGSCPVGRCIANLAFRRDPPEHQQCYGLVGLRSAATKPADSDAPTFLERPHSRRVSAHLLAGSCCPSPVSRPVEN